MIDHVTIGKFSEISGFSEGAIRTKMDKGVWLEGMVWEYAGDTRTRLISIEGYESWVTESGKHHKRA